MYPFFIMADTLQLFLHVKGLHYSIMKQLNINRLNFECLSKQFSERTVSVTQFKMSLLCNHFISLHNRTLIKRVTDSLLNSFTFYFNLWLTEVFIMSCYSFVIESAY